MKLNEIIGITSNLKQKKVISVVVENHWNVEKSQLSPTLAWGHNNEVKWDELNH